MRRDIVALDVLHVGGEDFLRSGGDISMTMLGTGETAVNEIATSP